MIIIIEGIYSMEGEMARLAEIVAIKKKYKVGGRAGGPYRGRAAQGALQCWGHLRTARLSSAVFLNHH